jgi:hypothetical protein
MQAPDRERFRAVMTGMAKVYEREIDAPLLDAYWLALREWSLDDFERAAGHLMATSKFMPRPADFNELRKAGQLTAGEAWEQVLKGRPLPPGGRAERAANIVGGQHQIRMADIERDLPHIQRRFMEAYNELTEVDAIREAIPQITRGDAAKSLAVIQARLGKAALEDSRVAG